MYKPRKWEANRQQRLFITPGDLKAQKLYEILSDMKTETLVDALDDMVAKDEHRDTW